MLNKRSKFKINPKRLNFSTKADEYYGNADMLDCIKDVNDVQFISEMNQFVK